MFAWCMGSRIAINLRLSPLAGQIREAWVSQRTIDMVCLTGLRYMAGHSHWHNIRHVKEEMDSIKQKTAMEIVRKMKVAVSEGSGTNPKFNSALAKVIEEGKSKDVSSSTMAEALKRLEKGRDAKGALLFIEGRGIGNCSVIIEAHTDKQKWTRQRVQHVLKTYGGGIGDSGIASKSFNFKGVLYSPVDPAISLDRAVEAAIEAGAEDVQLQADDNTYRFICDPKQLHVVKKALLELQFSIHEAQQEYVPHSFVQLDHDTLALASQMLDKLEALDEVTNVFDNIEAVGDS